MRWLAVVALAGCQSLLGIEEPADIDTGVTCIEREPAAPAHLHTSLGEGSLAGEPCLACHGGPGAEAPRFDFAGTVRASAGGPDAGAHVRVHNAAGDTVTVVTDAVGNFYVPAGKLANPFPAHAEASACPSTHRMSGVLLAGPGGDCNMCHDGSVTGSIIAQ